MVQRPFFGEEVLLMASYSDYLHITAALTRVEGRIAEEERLAKKIADGEAWLTKHGIDWDREYTDMEQKDTNRLVKFRQWRADHAKVREEIVEILTPVYVPIWRQWAEVADIEDPKAEHELHYEKVNRTACFISDHLKRLLPEEEWAAVEETSRIYRFVDTPEMVERWGLVEIRCLDCKTHNVTTVKQKTSNGGWQVWDRCDDCGANVTLGGLWKKQAGLDVAALPEINMRDGKIKPISGQLSLLGDDDEAPVLVTGEV